MTDDSTMRMIQAENARQTWLAERQTTREIEQDEVVARVRSMGYKRHPLESASGTR